MWNTTLSQFDNYSVPQPFTWQVGSSKTLRGHQDILSSEKYNHWINNTTNEGNVTNHKSFTIYSYTNDLTSKFELTHTGVTIKNSLEGTSATGGVIQFKDPWFIDYQDGQYANQLRNRGMTDAVPHQRTSPFYPNATTQYEYGQKYNGVFLDQDPTSTPTYYKVEVPQTQNITLQLTGYPLGRTHKFYFQKWDGEDVQYQNQNSTSTGIIFKDLDPNKQPTAKAIIKGTQLSDTPFSENKNGQRTFIKSGLWVNEIFYPQLHNIYESMGKIWYERNTADEDTWVLMNEGNPINPPGTIAKSPSICENVGQGFLFIVYQIEDIEYPYDQKGIAISIFHQSLNVNVNTLSTIIIPINGFNYNFDYIPVIAAPLPSLGAVVYDMPASSGYGFKGNYFSYTYPAGILALLSEVQFPSIINNTNCTRPTIAGAMDRFHMVYEESTQYVKYFSWHFPMSNTRSSVVSSGSSTIFNIAPVISLYEAIYPVVSWIGATYKYPGIGYTPISVMTRIANNESGTLWGNLNYVSGHIQSVSNASSSSAPGTGKSLITWSYLKNSFSYSRWQKIDEHRNYTIPSSLYFNSMPINGIRTQASTDEYFNYPQALVFNQHYTPHYFIKSTNGLVDNNSDERIIPSNQNGNLFLGKITKNDTIITFGRSGVASINEVEFVFEIGDVVVDDSVIRFIEIPDTLVYNSASELNQHTRTNNFTLTPNSSFYFSNIYHVVQKSDPDTSLLTTDVINFKAELVNTITNQVVGTFDNITYNKNSVEKYASIDYEVDCSGITAGAYFLRLVTTVNGNAAYTLANIFNENTTLARKNYNKVKFTGNDIPITYDLAQNFPNPFNPGTTIRYQIPQDGVVTLKIYDILGAEVATLVNEEKIAGKYEVNFSASSFASGVYIYRIQAGNFISSKKMVLLK